jgi:4-hydroxybenzoate polyprenyltransferase
LLAVDAGHSLGTGALVTSAVFTGQLSIGWSNDLIDVRRDRSVQRADKPLARGDLASRTVVVAVIAALVACVVLSLLCGVAAGLTHLLLGVGSGWSYNLGLKRTVLSWLPYAAAFGSLTAVVWLALRPPALPPAWLMVAAALLGVGAHFVNVVPDLRDDAATGVRGLPHRLGQAGSALTAAAVLVVASAVVVLGPMTRPPIWAWVALAVVLGLATVAWRSSGRIAFRATVVIALIDVAILLAR